MSSRRFRQLNHYLGAGLLAGVVVSLLLVAVVGVYP